MYPSTTRFVRDESGVTLVIALVFVILGALVVGGLTGLAGTNLKDTANLQGERSLEYAADGALDGAIQALRYQPLGASGQAYNTSPVCPTFPSGSSSLAANGVTILVTCQGTVPPGPFQRQVIFTACLASIGQAACAGGSGTVASAQVLYYDLASDNLTPRLGNDVSIQSWSVKNG